MGTQGAGGRKRTSNKEKSTAEDDALNLIAREAEARLAAKRAARAEAREIRMKELERQQKELSDDDERMSVGSRGSVRVDDREYLEKGSRAASALTAGTLTSLGGTSSRRGSGETAITVDAETSIREIKEIHELKDQIQDVESKYTQNLKEVKDALGEVEEKYRKAMVSNAQLDNEKNNLMYLVDTLKDSMMELEEMLSESRREYEDKVKEHEREKQAHKLLQFQCSEMKETLKQSEELLNKHGIVLGPDLNINGDTAETPHDGTSGGDSEPTSQTTPAEGNGMLGHTEGFRSGEDEERGLCQGRLADPSRPDRTSREETELLDRQMLEDLEDAQKQDVQDKKSNDDVQETKNSLEETSPGTEEPMGESNTPESEDQETPAGDILLEQESSSRTREVTVEPTRDRNKSEELERTAGDITEDPKEGPPGPDLEEEPETSVNITNTDQNLEPGPTEADAEEPMDTSQPSSGKKKKKKRRGKKKNVPQEEKKQQTDVNEEKEGNKQNETEKSKAVEGSTVGDIEEQQRSTVKNEPHICPLEPQIVNQIQTEVDVEGSTVGDVEQQQRSSVENGPHCSLEPQMDNQIHTVQDSHLTVDLEADSQVNQVAIEQMGEETKAGSKGEPTEESHVDQRGEDGAEEVITKQASRDDKEAETSRENANDELITGEIKAGTDVELNECEMNLLRTELERENEEVQEPLLQVEDCTMIVDILEEAQRTFEPDEGPTEELDEIFSYSDALKKGLMDLVPGGPDLGKEESGEESLEVEDAPVGEPSKHPDSEIGLADTTDSGVFATEKLGEDSSADPVVSSKSTDYEALMDSALELMEVSENPEKRSEILSPDTSEKTCIIKDGLEEPEEGRSHPDNGNLDEEPGLEGEQCVDVGSTTIKQENAADANICVSQEILNVSVSEEVLNQDVSEEVLNQDVSGEVLNQNVPDKVLNRDSSEEVLNQNVSEEVLNQNISEEVLNHDVSGEVLDQEVSEEVLNQDIPQEVLSRDVSGEVLNQDVSKEHLNQDASEVVLNQDVSGKVLNRDVPEEVLSRDVSKEVSNQDVSGECLNQEVQYEAIDEAPDSSSAEVVTLEDPAEAACQVYGESEDTGHIIRPDLLQEDDEEDEGQSFDFDELDFDSVLDLKDNPEVEEAEEALEVLEEAAGDSPSMKSISTEEWIEDVGGRSEDDCKALSEETTPDVRLSEDLSKEAVSTDSRLEDDIDTSVFQSNPDHKASNKEPPRSKKSGKKGKGKSKEECKMS